jgi:hypothetical protein
VNRDNEKSRPWTMLQEEPKKDRHLGREKTEGITGISNQDLKEQLHLESERTCSRIFTKALVLETIKRRVKPSVRI